MNVPAVFAPKKVYGRAGSEAFNCVPKLQFAATTRTKVTGAGSPHGVPPWLGAVRRRDQIVPIKNAVCTGVVCETQTFWQLLRPRRRYMRPCTVLRKTIV